jgi:hypothetical protein
MMSLFTWTFVFAVFWGLGILVGGIAYWRKNYLFAKNAALFFFCLPGAMLLANFIWQNVLTSDFERSKKEVARLCALDGGDKIYKTVDNVQGVLQMRARKPDVNGSFNNVMRDQYGMDDPYGSAQGDSEDMTSEVGRSSLDYNAPPRGKQGYWFIEQQPKFGSSRDSGYRRNYLAISRESRDPESPTFVTPQMNVSKLKSRYGYLTEDLTTKEMRDHWIGAGRIKIIDLQTNEVLAERKGYYVADGYNLPEYADRWAAVGAYMQKRICPSNNHLQNFLQSVLKPPQDFPTTEQLHSIAEE